MIAKATERSDPASESDSDSASDTYIITDGRIRNKSWIIYDEETNIDIDEAVYLFTWSPDPAELPDCDFITQHNYNVNFLADYLKSCKNGLICVEATQQGNPHYHGWYQVEPTRELERISRMKTMKRFGLVKITECFHINLKNTWSKKANGLYYYKKECLDSMLEVKHNPITRDSYDDTDFNAYTMFFTKTIKDKKLQEKVSARQYYLAFYRDSNA